MLGLDLKQRLLSFGFFIDNAALDTYIELMSTAKNNSKLDLLGYSEWHHVIPVACYKQKYKCKNRQQALSYADKDSTNIKVALLYKDHCRAHYLLYLCTKGLLKHANAETPIPLLQQEGLLAHAQGMPVYHCTQYHSMRTVCSLCLLERAV